MAKTEKKSRIGARIRRERERLGLTQGDFAKAIGVGRLSSIHYELGDTSPNTEVLLLMKDAGVDIWFVLTGEAREDLIDQRAMEKAVDLLLKMIFDLQAKPDAKVMNELLLHFYRSIRSTMNEEKDISEDPEVALGVCE